MAQLVERLLREQEVVRSNRITQTTLKNYISIDFSKNLLYFEIRIKTFQIECELYLTLKRGD